MFSWSFLDNQSKVSDVIKTGVSVNRKPISITSVFDFSFHSKGEMVGFVMVF